MNEFICSNKTAGIYWLQKPIEKVKILVKLQPQNDVSLLPTFEECTNVSNQASLLDSPNIDEYLFSWQEKVFSHWEITRYNDIHNCLTENELNYHRLISENEIESSKLFTYIHEDYYSPLPNSKREKAAGDSILSLNTLMQKLNLSDHIDKAVLSSSSSMCHLFRSEENLPMQDEEWTAMHIVFDNSQYNEDSQLLLKQEAKLVSLYYNKKHKYLIISPNMNKLELNPYTVEPMMGVQWGYQYSVELELGGHGDDELSDFLKKLHEKWEEKHQQLVKFITPTFGKKQCCVFFEISMATHFEYKDLYIEFTVKVPEIMECNNELHGRTHVSRALTADDEKHWHFGHILDLELTMDDDAETTPLKIFLEAISIDWSGRHRTEGYCYLPLTLEPGRYRKHLSCSRPEEKDRVEAESRRFFVGGCNLIKDLDILAEPQSYETNFTYTHTGVIIVEWSTIVQRYIVMGDRTETVAGSSSAVLRGADLVLTKYRQARARLRAVTRDQCGAGDA